MRIAFVTNFCPYYRVRTFEALARLAEVDYFFFSDASEHYWENYRPAGGGDFHAQALPGPRVLGQRLPLAILRRLAGGGYDVWLKDIDGALSVLLVAGLARLRRQPWVLWTGLWHHPQTPFHRLTFPLTRWVYRQASAIVCYGEHVRRYLAGLGVEPRRLFVTAHAQDNELYARPVSGAEEAGLRAQLGLLPDERVILFTGRLEEVKGVPYLLEAAAQLADLRPALLIVGEGSLRPALEAQARVRSLRAIFTGAVPVNEIFRYYSLADVCAMPSVTTRTIRETWGLVVNEAMCQGVPVVASEAVGAAAGRLVRDEETGLVVPERDSAALAAALRRLLTDELLRTRLGQAGRAEVSGWTQERMARDFLAALEYAAREGRR